MFECVFQCNCNNTHTKLQCLTNTITIIKTRSVFKRTVSNSWLEFMGLLCSISIWIFKLCLNTLVQRLLSVLNCFCRFKIIIENGDLITIFLGKLNSVFYDYLKFHLKMMRKLRCCHKRTVAIDKLKLRCVITSFLNEIWDNRRKLSWVFQEKS